MKTALRARACRSRGTQRQRFHNRRTTFKGWLTDEALPPLRRAAEHFARIVVSAHSNESQRDTRLNIQVLCTSRRAIEAPVLGSWVWESLVLVGWLLVGWLSVLGCLVVGWLVVGCWLVGWWSWLSVVGGRWLVAVLVGLLLVPGGWWVGFGLENCFRLLGTTPSNLERRWLGAGGGTLWLGWWAGVSVSELPGRKPCKKQRFS